MKIQYLGFIPAVMWIFIAHYKVWRFYKKYKTLDYFSDNVPSTEDPLMMWTTIVVLFWIMISILGFIWGIII